MTLRTGFNQDICVTLASAWIWSNHILSQASFVKVMEMGSQMGPYSSKCDHISTLALDRATQISIIYETLLTKKRSS